MNAIQSAFGMVKSLLPLSIGGGALPVAPKLPDVPSFLESVSSMLQSILGTSNEASKPAAEDSKESTSPKAQTPPLEHESPAPRNEPKVPQKSGDQVVRDREKSHREAERRSKEETPADSITAQLEQIRKIVHGIQSPAQAGSDGETPSGTDSASGAPAPTIKDLLLALEELRMRAGISVEGAPGAETTASSVPETVPTEVQPPVGTPVAAAAQAKAVVIPTSDVPDSLVPELLPPQGGPAPVLAKHPDAPAKEELLPRVEELVRNPAAGTDPTWAPAAWMAAAAPVVVEAVSGQDAVEMIDRPTAVRQGPSVEGAAGPGPAGSGSSVVSSAPEASGPEGTDMVERIVQAARLTQSRGASRIKIALNPPNLGELKVDLSVRQRVLHGSLQAENPAAKEMILSQLQSLKDSLADQGIQVGEFQVSVDPSFQQAMQQQSDDDRPRSGASAYAAAGSEDPAGSVQERIRSARMQMFDMVA